MSPHLEKQLLATYSDLLGYVDHDGIYQPRVHAIECGDGWFCLIDYLLESAYQLNRSAPELKVEITQIKEKFGELRVYYAGGDDEISSIVDRVENLSASTCEVCGRLGSQIEFKGWIMARCSHHIPED